MKFSIQNVLMYSAVLLLVMICTLSSATLEYNTVSEIDHIYEDEIVYLSLKDLANALNLEFIYNPTTFQAILSSHENRMTVDLFSTYVRLDDGIRNIVYPVLYRKADFYLPAMTITPVLADLTHLTMIWDNTELTIRVTELENNVLDLKFSPKSNGYLCEIILAHPLEYEVLLTEGNWINVTLQEGSLNESYIANRPHSRVIRRIRAFEFENSSQISINLRRSVNEIDHNIALNPPRIQISIIDTLFDYSSVDTIFTEDDIDPIDLVIIDPGHGGIEDGALGGNGTKEKDIVLDIAMRLKEMFSQEEKINILLTREIDTTLLLDERAAIANNSGGDLFVSIHVNAYEKKSVKGTQTFFLAAALNDAARATAMLENRSILIGKNKYEIDTLDDLSFILFDLMQTEFLAESQMLAKEIQDEMVNSLQTKNRGVDQAAFFVLNQVYMPSVLVEVAFITNKHEETLLKKDSFRQKAAEGIYRGIKNFIDKYVPER